MSGFSYLRARYYDPEIGRFLSGDPLGGGYAYAGNNPMSFVDPSGLALTVVCDAFDGNGSCAAAHYEGTVVEAQAELDVLGSSGAGDSAPALLLEAAVNSGGAPTDDVASPIYVAVDTSADPKGSGPSSAGGSAVVGTTTALPCVDCTAVTQFAASASASPPEGGVCAECLPSERRADWPCTACGEPPAKCYADEWFGAGCLPISQECALSVVVSIGADVGSMILLSHKDIPDEFTVASGVATGGAISVGCRLLK